MNGQNTPGIAYDLKGAKEQAVKLLLRPNSNVVGIGIGKKVKDGQATPEDCVRVYVVSKIGPNDLSPNSLVPSNFLGVPTDVIEVGHFGRKGHHTQPREDTTPRPGSPIRVKTNAPNVNEGQRGTLGAVVTDGTRQYILSCNHILAVNGRVPKEANIVSAEFVGTEDTIAEPGSFIEFQRDGGNSVDCAVAPLPARTIVQATFTDGLGLSPDGPADPQPDMKVTKFGAVTGRTYGTIADIDADLYVDYSFGTFRFDHQVMIDGGSDTILFAAAGDSGSIAADTSTKRATATAMIFAASGRFAVACPLKLALEKLAAEAKVNKLSVVV
ncbi:conserved hypothetical protein [Candidatus Sulfopaludibacter sp. SbA6]|nr:conserved hypothetical protein [Candidatus Sulfopaludibacter sp. SbA6]